MQLLAFVIVYPLLWLISILPFRVIYGISDGIAFILNHIVGYRKKVIINNIKLVFPEKNDTEIKAITKTFYKHFCDLFLEMLKTLSISNNLPYCLVSALFGSVSMRISAASSSSSRVAITGRRPTNSGIKP